MPEPLDLDTAFARFEAGTATAQELADALTAAIAARLYEVLGTGHIAWTNGITARAAEAAFEVVSPYADRLPLVRHYLTPRMFLRGIVEP